MQLSLVVPVLDSHEIVRRQLLHLHSLDLPETVEILYVDDGSDPPINPELRCTKCGSMLDITGHQTAFCTECKATITFTFPHPNFRIIRTGDTRPWTWALARNRGAREAVGKYLLMADLDYIIPKDTITAALAFSGDYMGLRREFGVLDATGGFTQNAEVLKQWGLTDERIRSRGTDLPPHPNNFIIRRDLFLEMCGYREDLIGQSYPQGEDNSWKQKRSRWREAGKLVESPERPTIFMFPNGRWCGDVDSNPFGLFHTLSRKSPKNPWVKTDASVAAQPLPKSAIYVRSPRRALSVIIPGRNEMFHAKTVECVLANIRGDTEIIAVCDGYCPDPPIPSDPRVTVLHFPEAVGQRGAINAGARLSQSKFMMKLDAHCTVDEGFDVKLMEECEYDWTVVPKMINLHGFDWMCRDCGHRVYQGPKPAKCEKCGSTTEQEMVVVWEPRWSRVTYSWRFDRNLHFQYWRDHRKRPETRRGDFIETMSFIGACWFMHRDRYWELEGLDENHGSWGQVGTELACKSWLSGGKLLTCKKTWFSHMFRTRSGFSFPYPMSGEAQDKARKYSQDLWLNNKWPKQVHPLSWLVQKFAPVPDWEDMPNA